jgi:uncharacterized protein YbcI
MPGKRTKGEAEADFTRAIIRFEKEYLGRGPADARTFFIQDMLVVRLRGILSPAELKLAESPEGRALVKETRRRLFETSRDWLEAIVREVTTCQVVSLHTDMSTRTGERVIIITVDKNLEDLFL